MATFKTRIQNKIDTYSNWNTVNPTPLKGEICIVLVPAEAGAVQQEPATLIKVGDGTSDFKSLPWLSGKAADIYDWAKAAEKPSYEAKEITGISEYISQYVESEMGISVDTDTQYQLVKVDDYNYKLQSKGKGDAAWADVAGSSFVIPKYDDTALAGRVSANETAIGLLNSDASTIGSVANSIAAAIAALKLSETYEAKGAAAEEAGKVQGALDAYIESNNAAVKKVSDDLAAEVLRADAAEKANAAAAKAADDKAVAAQGAVDALAGKVGEVPADTTVVEMIAAAQEAATYDDTELSGRVSAIEGDYLKKADKETLQGNINTLADRVSDNEEAIALLNDGAAVEGSVDYKIAQAVAQIMENPDETMNSINELVTWINGHAQDALKLSNQVEANKGDIAALEGLVGEKGVSAQIADAIAEALKIDGVDKYALASDLTAAIARIVALEAVDHDHSNKSVLDGITAAKVSAWDAAEQNAKDHADGLNTAMNSRVEALEAIDHDHANKTVLDGISAEKVAAWDAAEGNAKAYTDTLEGKLAAVAKSGNVADLVQTAGEYITFDCGTATEVM